MRLSQLAATLLVVVGTTNTVFANPVQSRDTVSAKYCDASTHICYSEFISPEKIAYRFAIPDNATAGNFDILLQIVAPKTVGWAGLAWGGTSKFLLSLSSISHFHLPHTVLISNTYLKSGQQPPPSLLALSIHHHRLQPQSLGAHLPPSLQRRHLQGPRRLRNQRDALDAERARPGRECVGDYQVGSQQQRGSVCLCAVGVAADEPGGCG